MSYEKVIIAESLGVPNEFGKPITFLGIMKENNGFSEWTNTRREIVLAFGKGTKDDSYYVGEVKKSGSEWKWVWAIPVADIRGYENLVKHIEESKK
jgi:hypothetical protein